MSNVISFEEYRKKKQEELAQAIKNHTYEGLMAVASEEQFKKYDSEDR